MCVLWLYYEFSSIFISGLIHKPMSVRVQRDQKNKNGNTINLTTTVMITTMLEEEKPVQSDNGRYTFSALLLEPP